MNSAGRSTVRYSSSIFQQIQRKKLLKASAGCAMNYTRLVMKVLDIPRSGKRGDRVWQSNRYGQYSYPAFIPFNPRTPAQVAVRGTFGAVSARWRTLTEEQRVIWCAVARTKKSKPRLQQCGPLTGFLLLCEDQRCPGESGPGSGGPAAGIFPGFPADRFKPPLHRQVRSAARRPHAVPAR